MTGRVGGLDAEPYLKGILNFLESYADIHETTPFGYLVSSSVRASDISLISLSLKYSSRSSFSSILRIWKNLNASDVSSVLNSAATTLNPLRFDIAPSPEIRTLFSRPWKIHFQTTAPLKVSRMFKFMARIWCNLSFKFSKPKAFSRRKKSPTPFFAIILSNHRML